MPVVARLNSVVCACKSKQCRVDALHACVFDTATLASSSVFTPLVKLLPQTSPYLAKTHIADEIQPSRTTERLEWEALQEPLSGARDATRGHLAPSRRHEYRPTRDQGARGAARAGS